MFATRVLISAINKYVKCLLQIQMQRRRELPPKNVTKYFSLQLDLNELLLRMHVSVIMEINADAVV